MRIKRLTKILKQELGPISFGGFMRAARAHRDLSQVEMAHFLKISNSKLCDIEKGRQIVSIELAAKMAKKCKLSVPLAVEATIRDHLKKAKLDFNVKILNAV